MKKFYKTAESGTAPGGHVVRLDGKVIKTPLHHNLIVPTAALAAAMAEEWAAQGADVVPASMPMTQLANTMLDKGRGEMREEIEEEVCNHGASDLICYFATHPQDIVDRQKKEWLPLIAWMTEKFSITLETVSGIQYHNQPIESLDALVDVVEKLSPAEFTIVQAVTGVTGSLVIALALLHGKLTVDEAYQAACVDEIYQIEKWGADALAQKRLDGIRAELTAVVRFRDLVAG